MLFFRHLELSLVHGHRQRCHFVLEGVAIALAPHSYHWVRVLSAIGDAELFRELFGAVVSRRRAPGRAGVRVVADVELATIVLPATVAVVCIAYLEDFLDPFRNGALSQFSADLAAQLRGLGVAVRRPFCRVLWGETPFDLFTRADLLQARPQEQLPES